MFGRILNIAEVITTRISLVASSIIILIVTLFVIIATLMRYFDANVWGAIELVSLIMVGLCGIGQAWTQSQRGHVIIDTFFSRMSPKRKGNWWRKRTALYGGVRTGLKLFHLPGTIGS